MLAGKKRQLEKPELQAVALACGKQPAQVLLRWALQMGLLVIPKSVHPERQQANRDVGPAGSRKGRQSCTSFSH